MHSWRARLDSGHSIDQKVHERLRWYTLANYGRHLSESKKWKHAEKLEGSSEGNSSKSQKRIYLHHRWLHGQVLLEFEQHWEVKVFGRILLRGCSSTSVITGTRGQVWEDFGNFQRHYWISNGKENAVYHKLAAKDGANKGWSAKSG